MRVVFSSFAVLLFVSCMEPYSFQPDKEEYPEPLEMKDSVDVVIKEESPIAIKSVDTIVSVKDTSARNIAIKEENLSGVFARVDLGRSANIFASDSQFLLAKAKTDRSLLVQYRKSKVNYVEFVFYDTAGRATRFVRKQDISKGIWVGVVMVPPGLYEVKVNLYHGRKFPWSNSWLFDESFESYDSVDLRVKKTDTVNCVFRELECMDYFVKMKNAPGKYTIGKKYQVVETTRMYSREKALFDSSGDFCYALHCTNTNKTTGTMTVSSDTGISSFSFYYDLNTVMDDDIVEVNGRYVLPSSSVWDHESQLMATGVVVYSSNRGLSVKYNRNTFVYPKHESFVLQIIGPLPSEMDVAGSGSWTYNVGTIDWSKTINLPLTDGSYIIKTSGAIDEYYKNLADDASLHIATEFVDTITIIN